MKKLNIKQQNISKTFLQPGQHLNYSTILRSFLKKPFLTNIIQSLCYIKIFVLSFTALGNLKMVDFLKPLPPWFVLKTSHNI